MKIILFFGITNSFFNKFYIFFKKCEIEKIFKKINRNNQSNNIVFQFYCLNKNFDYTKKIFGKYTIFSLLDECIKIKRGIYNVKIEYIFSRTKSIYENITKLNKPTFNYYWKILEPKIKFKIIDGLEKIEFIKSIIEREKSNDVVFILNDLSFFKTLFYQINKPNVRIVLLKSKLDFFITGFDKIIKFFKNLFCDINSLVINRINFFKKSKKIRINYKKSVGILSPTLDFLNYFKEIIETLKKNEINVEIIDAKFEKYNLTFNDFKRYYSLLLRSNLILRKYWKKEKIKEKFTKNTEFIYKELFFNILKNIFFENIVQIIFWHKNLERVIRVIKRNFKFIIVLDEKLIENRIFILLCNKYHISTYYIHYKEINQWELKLQQNYLSELINVNGKIEKDYLVKNGIDDRRIVVKGSLKYEHILNKQRNDIGRIIDHFSKKINIISKSKTKVLLITNPLSKALNNIIFTSVINVLKTFRNIQFIIKIHPQENGLFYQTIIKELEYETIIIKEVNKFDIIKTSDIVLTYNAKTVLDSMVLRTPVLLLDFFNERLKNSHSFIYNDEAYILKSYNKQDLHKKLGFLLNYPKNLEKYKRRIEKNLSLFLYFENDHSPKKEICFALINYMNIWMSIREIECIKSYLCDNDIMLEWGAGGTTSYFSKFVKKYYSIEHDEKWFNIVKNQINSNVAFYIVKQNLPRTEPTKREEFKDYIEFIHKINVPVFNKVLIDGRARLFCAIEVLPFLNSDSIVFIHDFYPRRIYYPVLEYYEKIYEIKEKQGLVVLKKKTLITKDCG